MWGAVCRLSGQPFESARVPSVAVLWMNSYTCVWTLCSLIPDLQEFALQAQLRKAFLDCARPRQSARQSGKMVFLFWEALALRTVIYTGVVWIVLWTGKLRKDYCFLFIGDGLCYFRKMEWFSRTIKLSEPTGTKRYLICGQTLNENLLFASYNIKEYWLFRYCLECNFYCSYPEIQKNNSILVFDVTSV